MKQDAFKLLRTIHFIIVASITFFTVLIFVLFKRGQLHPAAADMERTLQVSSVLLSLILFVIGLNLFKRNMLKARNSTESGEVRFGKYRTACILWWAMIEGPGLFAVVAFALTGSYAFLLWAAAHILALIIFMPRKDNLIVLLNLTSEDVKLLEGKS
jgi:nitrate reductase NapE component